MARNNTKKTRRSRVVPIEPDSTFFLKLVMYLIVGSQWLRIERLPDWSIPIPIGLVIGLAFAMHDHFAIDRKIEYAMLLASCFIALWLPMGILVNI